MLIHGNITDKILRAFYTDADLRNADQRNADLHGLRRIYADYRLLNPRKSAPIRENPRHENPRHENPRPQIREDQCH